MERYAPNVEVVDP